MSRPPSFADLDAALASLDPAVRRKKPKRPVLAELTEARRVHAVAEPLCERFATLADFDLSAIDCLPALAERAECAELAFVRFRSKRARVSLSGVRNEAIALRFRLVAAARHALRADPTPLIPLEGFHRRRALPNLVSDLTLLAGLVDEHVEAFASAGGLPDAPAEVARKLCEALVRGPSSPAHRRARGDRNAAFALLVLALAEVRSGGRYLFRYEPKVLALFSDRLLHARRGRVKQD